MSEVNGSNNQIPVTDVTHEEEKQAVFLELTNRIAELLAEGVGPALFLRLGDQGKMDIAMMADDGEMYTMAIGLVTMIGAQKLGEENMASLPDPAVAQAMAQVTGLRILNQIVSAQANQVAPQTPAGDAGAVH